MLTSIFSLFIAFLTVISLHSSIQAQVHVGAGSYTTVAPGNIPSGTPQVTDDFSQKVTTDKWWVNFFTQKGFTTAYAFPLTFDAGDGGLDIGYEDIDRWGQNHRTDISVGMSGLGQARVARYSDWAITMRWEGGGNTMEATMGQGMPFVYFSINGGNVNISGGSVWYNENGVLGVTANNHPYAVFGPTGCSWSTGGTVSSDLDGKGYLSVALLPDESEQTLEFFKTYAYSHITETHVWWDYSETDAHLISHFTVTTDVKEGTENGTIFALMKHQWPDVVTPLTDYTYSSVRGEMKVAVGQEFVTSMMFNGILPAFPYVGHDIDRLTGYVNSQSISRGSDTYSAGYRMGHCGHVAQIANLSGNTQKRDEIVNTLKEWLEAWFTAGGDQQFYYNDTWNRLIGYPASYGSDVRLSDHHFHYGYFIQACAIIAKWDPDWTADENWGGMAKMLIRDISAFEENDPLFGRFQTFDPYEGHGWADGMGFASGNNQESASESMNCNSGLINFGIQTGNKTIRDMGIFMYVNEARAIANYWWDADEDVFPDNYDHTVVGMVWGHGGAYGTWFSGNPSHIHGISLLPITGGSFYMGRVADYIPKNFEEGCTGEWNDIFYEFLAFSDAPRALNLFNGISSAPASGSMALCYYNISSLNAAGRLCLGVGADVPSYGVFDKDNQRTYTAYNPEFEAVTVTFTDGFSMEVPARTQITEVGSVVSTLDGIKRKQHENVIMTREINIVDGFRLPRLDENVNYIELFDLQGRRLMGAQVRDGRTPKLKGDLPLTKGIYIIKTYE